MSEHNPEKHPHFATWTWDVHVYGGQWRAEYGWKRPPVPRKGMAPINVRPLYKHPVEPLTEEQIDDIGEAVDAESNWCLEFARAIEKAHGITPADAKEGE